MGMMTLLAQASEPEPSLGGWYVGVAIGFVVIVVVVVIVAFILDVATKIRRQAEMATEALNSGQVNTLPLWDVATTNRHARAILQGATLAREAVEERTS